MDAIVAIAIAAIATAEFSGFAGLLDLCLFLPLFPLKIANCTKNRSLLRPFVPIMHT
jgi:hypothetical protein